MKPLDLEGLVDLALRRGCSAADVLCSRWRRLSVVIERNEPKGIIGSEGVGVGIRVLYGGKLGFSYTSDVRPRSLEDAVERAIRAARARREEFAGLEFPSSRVERRAEGIFDDGTAEAGAEDLLELALSARDRALEFDRRVVSVAITLSVGVVGVEIANSTGLHLDEEGTSSSVSVKVVAEESGTSSSGQDYRVERALSRVEPGASAERAAEISVGQLRQERVESGDYQVLFMPLALSDLFDYTLIPALSAANVQEGRSFLRGRMGEEIAASDLDVVDDPLMSCGVGSRSFDDDGVASRRLELVKGGVLSSYLYDLVRAYREGRESTGHSSRPYYAETGIEPSNLVLVHPEVKDLDHMVSEIERGILVNYVAGAHTANAVTGEFSVAVGGSFLIIDGELGPAVKEGLIAGNVLDVLRGVSCLGREARFVGHLYAPPLLVTKLRVSG